MTSKADEFLKNLEKNLILKHISVDEFNNGGFEHRGQFIALKEISKEIRLKATKLCEGYLFKLEHLKKKNRSTDSFEISSDANCEWSQFSWKRTRIQRIFKSFVFG